MAKKPGDINVVQRFIVECPRDKVPYLRHGLEQMPFVRIVRTPMTGPINQLEAWLRENSGRPWVPWTFLTAKDVVALWREGGGREVTLAAMAAALRQSGYKRYPDCTYKGRVYRLWVMRREICHDVAEFSNEDAVETYLSELHEEPIHGQT